jgi:hypothetical protein
VSQQGIASEKERQVQLAHAQQESGSKEHDALAAQPAATESTDEGYAMVGMAALAVVMIAGATGRSWGTSPSLAPEFAVDGVGSRNRARRRARHRRRT